MNTYNCKQDLPPDEPDKHLAVCPSCGGHFQKTIFIEVCPGCEANRMEVYIDQLTPWDE